MAPRGWSWRQPGEEGRWHSFRVEWALLQSLRVPEARPGLPELQGAVLSIPPSREAPPPGTRAAARDLQVRSGLWVPHPQDATVPPGRLCLQAKLHSAPLPGRSPQVALGVLCSGVGALSSVAWLSKVCSAPVHASVGGAELG